MDMSDHTWNTTNHTTNVIFSPGWGWLVAALAIGVIIGYALNRYLP
jgi:hypothetical protein